MDTELRSPTPPWQPRALASWIWQLTKDVMQEVKHDGVGDLAASITFWTILSIPAATLSLVSTLGSLEVVVGESPADELQADVESWVSETFTDDAALNATVSELFNTPSRGVATVATLIALFTLSRAFAGLIRALDIAYEVSEGRPFWYLRIVAFGLGLGTIVVVASAAIALAVLPTLPLSEFSRWLVMPGIVAGLILWSATLFHLGPYHKTPWRYDLPGAIVTTAGWIIATQGFALYMRLAPSGNDIQTSVGTILLALTLMYLLSLILLLGAEVNDVISRRADVIHQPPPVKHRASRTLARLRTRVSER
jgi:membrane protein